MEKMGPSESESIALQTKNKRQLCKGHHSISYLSSEIIFSE